MKDHHRYFLLISKKTLNLNVKAIITCRFFWSFCWADRCNVPSTFYWSMRNTFKVRIKTPFINLINGLRNFHFTIFLDFSPSPIYLLHLFNGSIYDRIHNKQCMINCHGKSIIDVTTFFVNNSKAIIHYDDLQTLGRFSFWYRNPSKLN